MFSYILCHWTCKWESWISREVEWLVQGHTSRKLAEQNLESKSESRTFTLTISRYVSENVEGIDQCTLCNRKPQSLFAKVLQGCWGATSTHDSESVGQGVSALCFFRSDLVVSAVGMMTLEIDCDHQTQVFTTHCPISWFCPFLLP